MRARGVAKSTAAGRSIGGSDTITSTSVHKPWRIGMVSAVVLACLACAKNGAASNRYGDASGDGSPGQGSDSAVNLGFSKCIGDWPTAGGPHPMKPSLALDAPRVLWQRQDFGGSQSGRLYDGGPVLSGNRLAFQAGDWVYFVNKDGTKPQRVKYNALAAWPSALVADLDGNVYYSTPDGLYSLDANGSFRWSKLCGGAAHCCGRRLHHLHLQM
jgi:hypothetical protein